MRISSAVPFAILVALGLPAVPAHADQSRSFVSGFGNDANAPDCTRTAPCRTYQTAHDHTLANGEITVLDPGSYGSVAINRNISIVNDGMGEAGLLVSGGGIGISINAPGAAVTLRGLTIKGIGFGGGFGIVVAASATVNIENCTIRNLDGTGNQLIGTGLAIGSSSGAVHVTNTVITDNANLGILVLPPPGSAALAVVLDRVGLHANGGGGIVAAGASATGGKIAVTVNDSVASGNSTRAAFWAESASGAAQVFMMLNRSVAANNPSSGIASSGAVVGVNQSVIFNNASGWVGTVVSAGNNVLQGNAANEGPMPTFPLR
jgi:hypothetical protein